MDAFPRGSVLMGELMRLLMARVAEVVLLRQKLYQANFHTTLSGQAMVWRLPAWGLLAALLRVCVIEIRLPVLLSASRAPAPVARTLNLPDTIFICCKSY